jgi:putative ABC transport system ATP-binding protein
LIEVRRLTKYYRMGDTIVRALDGVDLTIERGEFVAITGASGSGKSTLMHLMGCLDRPTSGEYILNGQNVSELSDARLAQVRNREVGFVFQTFNLINRTTAAENVAVPLFYARRGNTRQPSLVALEKVGLGPRSHHRPNELSGGERQRVAIARAIVNDPPLLLADEPTGNLDTRTGEQIMQIFHELNQQGVTIVLVTHEFDVAMQARRIVHMRDGRILWDRPASEVKSTDFTVKPREGTEWAAAAQASGPRVVALAHATNGRPGQRDPVGAGAATGAEVAAEPGGFAESLPYARARLLPGANLALVCGIVAAALYLAAATLVAVGAARAAPGSFQPGRPPPMQQMMPIMIAMIVVVAAIIVGLVAMVAAVAAWRTRRETPGVWRGRVRAHFGFWLGLIAAALPVIGIATSIGAALLRGGR